MNPNDWVEDYMKLGYSHDEAMKLLEPAMNLSKEEIERIAGEFSKIGCTSFRLTPEQIDVLLARREE